MKCATKGMLWIMGGELIFVFAWAAIKSLGSHLPVFEIVFFRSFISLLIFIPLVKWRHHTFRGTAWPTLFLRSLFGWVAMILSFYSVVHINLGDASTLLNTLPIFVALFSPTLLGEPFLKKQFIFIIISFLGIAFVVKPEFVSTNYVYGYALLASVFSAFAMICIRKLHRTDSTLIINFYFTIFATVATIPFIFMEFAWPTGAEWILLCVIGVLTTFYQICMTKAYRFGNASTIAPFSYVSVIGAYIIGILYFNEIPDVWSILGAIIIVASGIGVIIYTQKSV